MILPRLTRLLFILGFRHGNNRGTPRSMRYEWLQFSFPSYAIHLLLLKLHLIFFLPSSILHKVNSANNDWGS